MELTELQCYRALISRDARFDGRFFVGVVTTGIYCRPICPAPTPKRQNVRFFTCSAAAESAGFRACLRCHPASAPGTPAWAGASSVVSRALRLISEGVLDENSLEDCAGKLGVGARHLTRLFAKHLGASPGSVARARRINFARMLLSDTNLPIAEVAFAAGFKSIRQFNHAMLATFGESPTSLRQKRKPAASGSNGNRGLVVKLPYHPPLDWTGIIRFLKPRAIPGVEVITDDLYRRAVRIGDTLGVIELSPMSGSANLLMRIDATDSSGLIHVVERARRIFDLAADPGPITSHLSHSGILGPLVSSNPGLRVPGTWDGFELAVRAILGQQVTVQGATTLAGRLVREFGQRIDSTAHEGVSHLFPTPEILAEADLSGVGLTRSRAATIRALARTVCEGAVVFDSSSGLSKIIPQLCEIPGIGEWTAHYIAMRAFGEPDAFPASDLGLRRAFARGAKLISARELESMSEEWRPWRAYAAMYLWAGQN